MTICIAQVFTQSGFSGCSVVVWEQPGAVCAGLQQQTEKNKLKVAAHCVAINEREKKALSNLAWIDVLKQIAKYNNACCAWQQNSIKVFQQYLQFIGRMDDQSNIFKILVQTLHPLQVRAGTWQLFLFFFFYPKRWKDDTDVKLRSAEVQMQPGRWD